MADIGATPTGQPALVASQSSRQGVSTEGFDQARGRKRNWRGRFVKNLRWTHPESREWLIFSHYHNAWHRRCSVTGGAAGYTADLSQAGLFDRAKADSYNDGDRNEAFHVSDKAVSLEAHMEKHLAALARLKALAAAASGGDAKQAPGEAPQSGPKGNAHPLSSERNR